jgi:hypothetical protein
MASPQTALQPSFADHHQHPANETCPYCDQAIPNDRAEEIHARYAFKQKQDEDAANARADKCIADARSEMEAAKAAEYAKWKADALADKTAALEEAKKHEREIAKGQIEILIAQSEAAAAKVVEAEQRRQEAIAQLEAQKVLTEEIAQARAAEARRALEEDNAQKMKDKDAAHAAEKLKLSDELTALQRKVASLEGEGDDIQFLDELKKAFPGDLFEPLKKNDGADIIHTIKHGKNVCGKIVYDCRNRKIWQDKFASLLHNDMVSAGAMHAILATTKFPKKGQQVCKAQGIILVHPGRVTVIADILREEVIRNFAQRTSTEDRGKKTAKLYDYITSEQFGNVLESLDGNVDQLMKIEEEDRKRQKKATESREKLYLSQRRLHAKLHSDIERITGTGKVE